MPSWSAHKYVDRVFLGRAYPKVHMRMDEPYAFVGRRHRIFFCDYASAYVIAREEYPGDDNAVWSGYLHIQFDELCSADPVFKELLENMARTGRKRKKKIGKRESVAILDDDSLCFLDKLDEITRLSRTILNPSAYNLFNVIKRRSPRRRKSDTIVKIPMRIVDADEIPVYYPEYGCFYPAKTYSLHNNQFQRNLAKKRKRNRRKAKKRTRY